MALNKKLLAGMAGLCLLAGTAGVSAQEKHKVFLSMSYIGNDWQAEASNMIKAMAAHPDLADKIDLQVQVAGPNAQKQIQQINSMVQAGAIEEERIMRAGLGEPRPARRPPPQQTSPKQT